MIKKKVSATQRRAHRPSVMLEIELPELSDEAAAAMASVLVQLYHRFEATYYAQILNYHADQACVKVFDGCGNGHDKDDGPELF